ncbi:cytochrome C oxidase subunit IV family protein [Sphingobium sp. CFD-1]|nr:cytochrome C oxidase subunit IV family protein [Sphingobium sp. CFD-1]
MAFAKVLLVGREFMELRHAPPLLLWLFQLWAVVTCVVLIVLFHA